MSRADFRQFVPLPGESGILGITAREHTLNRIKDDRAQELLKQWKALGEEPFRGITIDG